MSFNSLFGCGSHAPDTNLESWSPFQDNAASTTVVDSSGKSVTGTASRNTSLLATTGPNSYLTSALQFNGTSDTINFGNPASIQALSSEITLLCRIKPGSTAERFFWGQWNSTGNMQHFLMLQSLSSDGRFSFFVSSGGDGKGATDSANFSAGTWYHLAGKYDRTTIRLRRDKSQVGTNAQTFAMKNSSTASLIVGKNADRTAYFDGAIADVAVFSRALSDSECDEHVDGPEPVYVSGSDTITGTPQDGETLSVSSDVVYGLPAPFSGGTNGSITYSYQWTASDDGSGTGEANISGATGATFTATSAEVGKYLRRWRRASNTGGFDPAEDLASDFSGVILAAGGGGGNRRRRALICGRAA